MITTNNQSSDDDTCESFHLGWEHASRVLAMRLTVIAGDLLNDIEIVGESEFLGDAVDKKSYNEGYQHQIRNIVETLEILIEDITTTTCDDCDEESQDCTDCD